MQGDMQLANLSVSGAELIEAGMRARRGLNLGGVYTGGVFTANVSTNTDK